MEVDDASQLIIHEQLDDGEIITKNISDVKADRLKFMIKQDETATMLQFGTMLLYTKELLFSIKDLNNFDRLVIIFLNSFTLQPIKALKDFYISVHFLKFKRPTIDLERWYAHFKNFLLSKTHNETKETRNIGADLLTQIVAENTQRILNVKRKQFKVADEIGRAHV